MPGERSLQGVLGVFKAKARGVHALVLPNRCRAPIGLDRIGEEITVRNAPLAARALGQVQQAALTAQMVVEEMVHAAELHELVAFSEHDRPGDDADDSQAAGDHLADGIAAKEDLDEVGGG